MKIQTESKPENCGWILLDNEYHFYWFNSPISPSFHDILSNIGTYYRRNVISGEYKDPIYFFGFTTVSDIDEDERGKEDDFE